MWGIERILHNQSNAKSMEGYFLGTYTKNRYAHLIYIILTYKPLQCLL